MDDEVKYSYLRVVWPQWIYPPEDPDTANHMGPVQMMTDGQIVNSAYCPVTQKWHMLIAGNDNRFHDLTHDHPDLLQEWTADGNYSADE